MLTTSPVAIQMLDFFRIRFTLETMKITLTPQQKLQLEQMHDIERDSRVCDRIKAVLLASEGWSQTMISIDDYESINSETIVRFFCKLRELSVSS